MVDGQVGQAVVVHVVLLVINIVLVIILPHKMVVPTVHDPLSSPVVCLLV
jgi:hypothetical protein